jgi:hypothetical protein
LRKSFALKRLVTAGAAIGLLAAGAAALAQNPPAPQPRNAAPVDRTPWRDTRVPASVPNISGAWQTRGYLRRIQPADGSLTPWLPWTKSAFEKREAAEKAGAPMFDPTAACMPSGVPRIIAAPYPIEIIQTPDKTVILEEVQHLFRIIHMDRKTHPKVLTPSFMGDSVGWWEGDVLVVDTVGLTDKTQVDEAGDLHSGALHVVERIRKIDERTLEDLFTIDDPKAYSKAWTARRIFDAKPDLRFIEYVCEENNRNAPDANGKLRNF